MIKITNLIYISFPNIEKLIIYTNCSSFEFSLIYQDQFQLQVEDF